MPALDITKQRVCVTGGSGFLGNVVCKCLLAAGVPPRQLFVPRRQEFDLTRERDVERLYDVARPNVIVHLAAEVGGIGANRDHPGRFFYANLAMGLHLIENGRRHNLAKFVHVGTVCSYPKFTDLPFREDDLWKGYPEEITAPYGIAKKALNVMLEAYYREYALPSAVLIPVNLYGPGDNFDRATSHVVPALIRKVREAQCREENSITCWGSGNATREFLYIDDAAAAIVAAAVSVESPDPINLGTGYETPIRDLVRMICKLSGFAGAIEWDSAQPDGQPRRCVDISRAMSKLRWQPQMPLEEGLRRTIEWYDAHISSSPAVT